MIADKVTRLSLATLGLLLLVALRMTIKLLEFTIHFAMDRTADTFLSILENNEERRNRIERS